MKNKRNFIKKHWIRFAIGFLIIAGALMIIFNRHDDEDYKPRVCGGDRCFMVELARTPAEQEKGLMFRESMEEGDGMLFVFPQSDIYNFWMKNTLIPLDMLWIDDQLNVVKVITAQPCTVDQCPTYNPWVPAKYVLEINAGMAAKHEIAEWTTMRLIHIQ